MCRFRYSQKYMSPRLWLLRDSVCSPVPAGRRRCCTARTGARHIARCGTKGAVTFVQQNRSGSTYVIGGGEVHAPVSVEVRCRDRGGLIAKQVVFFRARRAVTVSE